MSLEHGNGELGTPGLADCSLELGERPMRALPRLEATTHRHFASSSEYKTPTCRTLDSFLFITNSSSLIKQNFKSQGAKNMPLPVFTAEKPSTSETSEPLATQTSSAGQAAEKASTSTSSTMAQTKSEAELAAEKLYEERIEDEYAKREGGA
ncbi:hypothetical protein NA57DRAFT_72275 [Rhizodiscina lignyota]|uniref:Uncharacterized protein n=1 Tax=Rhizodiscina lignyota TaxID=1504668 RepID=A0A9P4MF75_9PEZI|nr:hypothetical protein NA57DRAFT_72275 [Rhizodiscina lignyota]